MRSAPFELSKFIFTETLGSVLRFPFWWYGDGLMLLGKWIAHQLEYRWKSFAFVIWMRNLFVPMYGQYDWSGRLVSFIVRIAVLIGRGIFLCFEATAYLVLLLAYVSAPPFSLLFAIYSLLTRGSTFLL